MKVKLKILNNLKMKPKITNRIYTKIAITTMMKRRRRMEKKMKKKKAI